MKIAFSAEDESLREQFRIIINSYFERHICNVDICLFKTPEEMLESVEYNMYDLVFFKMSYYGKPGVKYVYKLRAFNPDIAVVMLNFTRSGRVEGIFVNPVTCVADEFTPDAFAPVMDIVLSHLHTNPQSSLLINTTYNFARIIRINSIVFVESQAHKVLIHMVSGEILEICGPMKNFAERLEMYSEFLYPHRSYIVNAIYVLCITPETIYLRTSQDTIPVARGKFKSIKESYDHYFRGFSREINLRLERF